MGRTEDIPTNSAAGLPPLGLFDRIAFSIGHLANDMFAVMWFAYTHAIYIDVLHISSVNTSILLVIGQLADVLVTPLVGRCIARGRGPTARGWHTAGTVAMLLTFPLLYGVCGGDSVCDQPIERSVEWCVTFAYVVPLLVVFHGGWAVVQVANMAMIAEMTVVRVERVDLFRMRFVIQSGAYFIGYAVCYGVLRDRIGADKRRMMDVTCGQIRMQLASLVVYVLAIISTGTFYSTLNRLDYYARRERTVHFAPKHPSTNTTADEQPPEPSENPSQHEYPDDANQTPVHYRPSRRRRMHPLYMALLVTVSPPVADVPADTAKPQPPASYLRTPIFYQIALMLAFAHCFMYSALYHIPLWFNNVQKRQPKRLQLMQLAGSDNEPHFALVIETDDYDTDEQSLIGMLLCVAAVLSVVWLRYLSHLHTHKRTSYLFGTLLSLNLCAWVLRHLHRTANVLEMGLAVVLFGIAAGLMIVSALAMMPDLLECAGDGEGADGTVNHGARVFADVKLLGKVVLCAAALVLKYVVNHTVDTTEQNFFVGMWAWTCGLASMCGLLALSSINYTKDWYGWTGSMESIGK